MEKIFKKGGYVRCIHKSDFCEERAYNQFRLGGVYEIALVFSTYVETVEGYRLWHTGGNYSIECEWVGMEKPDELVLPESWYIVVTEENTNDVSNWRGCGSNLQPGWFAGMYKWSDSLIAKGHNMTATPRDKCGLEITYEQFKKYVLKTKSKSMDKEIIGYEAPMDLFGGVVKKGTLYTPHDTTNPSVGWSPNDYVDGYIRCNLVVPEELVKQWNPVYKVKETDVVTMSGTVTVVKGKIIADGKEITYDGLKNLYDYFGPQKWYGIPWDVTIKETIKIGCWEVSKDDIATILREYQKLN